MKLIKKKEKFKLYLVKKHLKKMKKEKEKQCRIKKMKNLKIYS